MAIALWLFLLFASLYHVLVTVLVYGAGLLQPETIVILRDGIWFAFVIILALFNRRMIAKYLRSTRILWVIFLLIIGLGIWVSKAHGKTMSDIVVGAKYGMQFFAIFLSAIFVGKVLSRYPQEKMKKLLRGVFSLVAAIIVAGLVWQIAKMMRPEFFYSIGYAPLGDWVYGHNPPLYYLTGPGGYARLSGIFSGPNNYGYLFVGLFGFWRWYIREHVGSKSFKIGLRALFGVSVLWTMSRGAIVGIFLQLIALAFVLFHAKRKYIWGLIIAGVVVVVGLSLLKWGSTLAHLRAKFGSLGYVRSNPWGYGLGSSGPSIHTGHGTILPENFFVQILIDIGVPGLILWLAFWYFAIRNIWRATKGVKPEIPENTHRVLLICLSFGFLGLLLEGMFLHVFEDSMVNYRFFILWGMMYGYGVGVHHIKKHAIS